MLYIIIILIIMIVIMIIIIILILLLRRPGFAAVGALLSGKRDNVHVTPSYTRSQRKPGT